MKSIKYSRYTGEDLGISAEDLLKALSDFLLQSGFDNPYMQFNEMNQRSLEELKQAIERALYEGNLFDQDRMEEMMQQLEKMSLQQLDQLVDRLVQKLVEEGYLSMEGQPQDQQQTGPGGVGKQEQNLKVEITDKSVDFLGFKTLKDLLASVGHSSFGAHDTRDLATADTGQR